MHCFFDISTAVNLEDYFDSQSGGSSFYQGRSYMRGGPQVGAGLGNVLSSLWRVLAPVLRSAGSEIGKESLRAGAQALSNISHGEDVTNTLKNVSAEAAKNLLKKASARYLSQQGSGRALIGRRMIKRSKQDVLGSY